MKHRRGCRFNNDTKTIGHDSKTIRSSRSNGSRENPLVKRGGGNGAVPDRPRRVVIFDAPFQTRFQGVRNERDPCKRGDEETVQSVGDPVIIEGFRVSRVEEYRYGSKVN